MKHKITKKQARAILQIMSVADDEIPEGLSFEELEFAVELSTFEGSDPCDLDRWICRRDEALAEI